MVLSGISAKDIKDKEWENAENADEEPCYYMMFMNNGGRCIHRYKPSVAKLVSERSGLKLVPVAIDGNDGTIKDI